MAKFNTNRGGRSFVEFAKELFDVETASGLIRRDPLNRTHQDEGNGRALDGCTGVEHRRFGLDLTEGSGHD